MHLLTLRGVMNLPIAFKLVIKRKLFTSFYVSGGKNPNTHRFANDPFLSNAVWAAGMVDKSSQTTFSGCVDDLQ
jgi:hypothetical protein